MFSIGLATDWLTDCAETDWVLNSRTTLVSTQVRVYCRCFEWPGESVTLLAYILRDWADKSHVCVHALLKFRSINLELWRRHLHVGQSWPNRWSTQHCKLHLSMEHVLNISSSLGNQSTNRQLININTAVRPVTILILQLLPPLITSFLR
jgi:hypothetical protein